MPLKTRCGASLSSAPLDSRETNSIGKARAQSRGSSSFRKQLCTVSTCPPPPLQFPLRPSPFDGSDSLTHAPKFNLQAPSHICLAHSKSSSAYSPPPRPNSHTSAHTHTPPRPLAAALLTPSLCAAPAQRVASLRSVCSSRPATAVLPSSAVGSRSHAQGQFQVKENWVMVVCWTNAFQQAARL